MVRFFHPSFPDFVTDKERCTDERFLVDIPFHEDFMASQCMNMNRETHLTTGNPEFSGIIWYTVQRWSSHFRSGTGRDLHDEFQEGSIWFTDGGGTEGAMPDSQTAEETAVKSCFGETREGVLKMIAEWATGADDGEKHIFGRMGGQTLECQL